LTARDNPRRARHNERMRAALLSLGVLVTSIATLGCGITTRLPGKRADQAAAQTEDTLQLADSLRADVEHLALDIGERHAGKRSALDAAEAFLKARAEELGYAVNVEAFEARGQTFHNLVFERTGTQHPEQIFVVGAHYDTAVGTPGANDNGTGVASLLALAEAFSAHDVPRTLRFVLYANEEPPFFGTDDMGSRHHANASAARADKMWAMLSLETMGAFSDAEDSQKYPPPIGLLYPSKGDFIAFVSDTESRDLLERTMIAFRSRAQVPSEGGALPGTMPGVYWSDHWSYWRVGVPAVMVTDTAPFRSQHYHEPTDTPEKVDFHRLSLVVVGLTHGIDALLRSGPWRADVATAP
jgi:Peptidase family M28